MTVGTKSLFWGVHQFLLHPFFVLRAWVELYGWPKDWRILVAILVHDWGYWSKPNMDGPEGQAHPVLGAEIMERLFDGELEWAPPPAPEEAWLATVKREWFYFTACHSRYYARMLHKPPSRLCWADKLAVSAYPRWLYLLLARLSGELWEYMRDAELHADSWPTTEWERRMMQSGWPGGWYEGASAYLRRLVWENWNGK